jgi:hypothetical protein
MRYTAKLTQSPSGYSAECLELEVIGEGLTREAAIASLRAELEDRLLVEGVAPPSRRASTTVEIHVLEESGLS